MKSIYKKSCGLTQALFLVIGLLFASVFWSCPAGAAELGFKVLDQKMLFTIPYTVAPEVNALFFDRGDRVELVLPVSGLKVGAQELPLDDDWVTAFGIEQKGQELHWYLKKRDPALRVKSFLALERKNSALQVILLKEYRSWSASIPSGKPVTLPSENRAESQTSDKMSRIQQLLDGANGGEDEVLNGVDGAVKSSPSLLVSGLRSLVALVFLVLVILAISLFLKRYRRKRGNVGRSGIIKVLGVETISAKHQVMVLELLDEVMVVGVSGEQMTVLTTINDPDKVEELRQLKDGSQSGLRFGGYLKSFLLREPAAEAITPASDPGNAMAAGTYQRPATGAKDESLEASEELPENYQEVVSQIKNRLKNSDRSRLG
ncbi:MAG: flagellar biosynthetic protein FliO [Deltaproteobacteria bacterium]|nr:flagellar biosynthetic protein FliO [Candidatus Tharpella sp.]